MLTAASGGVGMLVREHVRRAGRSSRPPPMPSSRTSSPATAILQREHPQHRAMQSGANLACADYYQRMIDTGGRPELGEGEEVACSPRAIRWSGWSG